MHLLIILRLGKAKARDKLRPLLQLSLVDHITLVRHAPVPIESTKLIQVIHDAGLHDDGLPTSPWASLRNLMLCFINGWRVIQRNRIHAVIAFNLFPYGLIAWMVARLAHLPIVISLIGTDFDRRLHAPGLGWLLRAVLRDCEGVVVFGIEAHKQLLADGLNPDRLFVLPNTVDTELFYPDSSIVPDTDLIYVGNLHDFKRVDLILQALKIVRQARPETTLLIVGDGPTRGGLENLTAELALEKAVTFLGWSEDIPACLRRSRILLLLSDHEGLPAAVIEALCSGLPVIATNVGAVSSVVQDGRNGFLLPTLPNPLQVAECLLLLLTNSDTYQRMHNNALTTRETHGYKEAERAWKTILDSVNLE